MNDLSKSQNPDDCDHRLANDYDDEFYPFKNDCYERLTLVDKIQIAIMSVTVAPIRLVFVGISLLALWPVAFIATLGLTEANRHEPRAEWRRKMIPLLRFLSRCVFFSAGFYRIRVFGEQHLDPNTPIVVVAPHTGYMDALFSIYANFLSSVARAGTEQVPIFGTVVKVFQPIIVNREKSASRSDTVQKIIERVQRSEEVAASSGGVKKSWPLIGLFPQGTCSNQKSLIRFKSGAFIPGRPVQPVCIRYPRLRFDSITWTWEGPSVYGLAWLSLCQIHIPLEFHILPPYQPSEEEKANADLYAENVRRLMAQQLDIPLSDLSYEDGRLMSKMDHHGLPRKCGPIRVYDIKKRFGVTDEEIEALIEPFAAVANRQTGLCHLDTFASNLSLAVTSPVERLFKQFDSTSSGCFKFRHFVEVYFEKIRPVLLNQSDTQKLIQRVIQSFEKLKLDNEASYTFDELNVEIKKRHDIEFINSNLFESEKIGKREIEQFLTKNKLHLYLLATSI